MALRVLLADESTTIKKVMQLALQDFAVEVKAVHAGVDVLDVARSFQPDIIFADVLLQKKNGYEVCATVKNDPELKTIPVVLMWSSFMDLDETSARSSGAEARLEKPFDVETLRKQVLDLVPKTRTQRLSHFLEFSPRLNEELIEDPSTKAPPAQASAPQPPPAPRVPPGPPPVTAKPTAPAAQPEAPSTPPPTSDLGARLAARAATATAPSAQPPTPQTPARKGPPPPDAFLKSHTAVNVKPLPQETEEEPPVDFGNLDHAAPAAPPQKSGWSMESFEDPSQFDESEDFQSLELSQLSKEEPQEAPLQVEHDPDDEAWARQDLSQFKLDLPPISVGEDGNEFKIDMGEEEFTDPGQRAGAKPAPPPPAQFRTKQAPPDESQFGNDLTLESEQIEAADEEIALPLEPIDDSAFELTTSGARTSAKPPQGLGQMSAQELERVIRAQSREIIEQVVRKIVPDLAASIIREELERLLEDTAVRENRNL